MKSLAFPKMFNYNNSNVVVDYDATKQNTFLLLHSEKGELFGDPYFGIRLKRYIFDQNSYILKDVLIDEIYTQLALFLPQLIINRNDIKIIQDPYKKGRLSCTFKGINRLDFTTDMYSLVLYDEDNM